MTPYREPIFAPCPTAPLSEYQRWLPWLIVVATAEAMYATDLFFWWRGFAVPPSVFRSVVCAFAIFNLRWVQRKVWGK